MGRRLATLAVALCRPVTASLAKEQQHTVYRDECGWRAAASRRGEVRRGVAWHSRLSVGVAGPCSSTAQTLRQRAELSLQSTMHYRFS